MCYFPTATHIDSGVHYSDSVEVRIIGELCEYVLRFILFSYKLIVPHFIQVDQVVVSRIGDLLTLSCVPNNTMATVTWLKA